MFGRGLPVVVGEGTIHFAVEVKQAAAHCCGGVAGLQETGGRVEAAKQNRLATPRGPTGIRNPETGEAGLRLRAPI